MSQILVNKISPFDTGRVQIDKNTGVSSPNNVTLEVSGNAIFGTSSSETVIFNADIASDILPSTDGRSLGAIGSRWSLNANNIVADSLTTYASTDLSVSANGHIFINPAGTNNIAIGKTTAPSSPAGVARFLEIADASSAGISINDTAGTQWDIYSADGRLNFFAGNSGAGVANRMVILQDGQVGIGTLSPNQLLHVAGNTEIDGNLQVDGNLTVNGALTTIESTTLTVDDKNIELGTVASPSDATADGGGITLKGASDYTISWQNSSNQWTFNQAIHVNNTAASRFDGNIGVGVATPSSIAGVGRFIELSHESSAGIVMDDTGGTEFAIYSADNYINFVSEANIRAKLSDDGKFGLGVDPQRRLHVGDDAEIDGDLYCNDDVKLNSDSAILSFGADNDVKLTHNADAGLTMDVSSDVATFKISNSQTSGDAALAFQVSSSAVAQFTMGVDDSDDDKFKIGTTAVGVNTSLTIDGNGQLGLGTTSPAMPLHIVNTSGGRIMLHRSTGDTSSLLGSVMFGANNGDTNLAMMAAYHDGATDAGYISFETETSGGSMGERLRITSTGQVLFGDGSASAPAISNSGDTNCGLFFSAADTLAFTAGGTAQITFQDGAILPVTNNDIDLGSDLLEFKDAYFDGTVEADAITIGGVTLAETISDTVGAMVSSNTETGISVTYDDGDNTLDFAVSGITSSMITDGTIALADLADVAANSLLVRDANSSGVLSAKALATTQILIGNGTGFTAASLSGDATMTNGGAVTLAAAQSNISSIYNTGLVIGYGASDANIDFGTNDQINFDIDGTAQVVLKDGSFEPVTTDDINLGSSDKRFANVYTMDLHLANDRGDWTIIEEEDYLSIRNNKNGKLFKIVMQEISEE